MGATVAVGRGGAHGLGHVLDHDGELGLHGIAVERGHALVVHLEIVGFGVAVFVDVADHVALRRGYLLQVVAAVLQVLEVDDATFVGFQGLVEVARIAPDAENGALDRRFTVERIHLGQAQFGRGIGHVNLLVEHRDLLALVGQGNAFLGNVEGVAVFDLRLVYGVCPQVERLASRVSVCAGDERRHDLPVCVAQGPVGGGDVAFGLHDVGGAVDGRPRLGVGLRDGYDAFLGRVLESQDDRIVPSTVVGGNREGCRLGIEDVALGRCDLLQKVAPLPQNHRQGELAALVGGPRAHDLLVRVMEGIGDEIAVGVIQLEARRKRNPLAGFGVGLDHLERRLRDLVAHQNRRIVLPFVGDRDLEVIDGKEGLAVFRLELRGDVGGDDLVHEIGAVRQRRAPALGLRPAVRIGVAVFGGG